jgi:hypothetical protein
VVWWNQVALLKVFLSEAREIASVREISAICLDDIIINLIVMRFPDSLSPERNNGIAIE